jgi:hypothetical protein
MQLNLTGATHATFEDIAVLLPQAADALGLTSDQVAATVGAINGERAVAILRTYVSAYFDRYLLHHPNRLLRGPSPQYPEVQFSTDNNRRQAGSI